MKQITSPCISIITPCYNQELFLCDALDSVIAQTYKDWELIVVDDGSTDNSSSIAKKYVAKDSRIRYIYQDNAGPSAARNKGVKMTSGKYLFFLDSDNKLAPQYFEIGIKYMEEHKKCTVFYTKINHFGELKGLSNIHYTSYKDLLFLNSIDCACIVRRNDFERIGGFDEQLLGYEDWEFFIRLLYRHDVVYQSPLPLFYYRITTNHNSVNVNARKKHDDLIYYIYNKNQKIYHELWGTPYKVYFNMHLYKEELNKLKESWAYKLGYALISPFRIIKKYML